MLQRCRWFFMGTRPGVRSSPEGPISAQYCWLQSKMQDTATLSRQFTPQKDMRLAQGEGGCRPRSVPSAASHSSAAILAACDARAEMQC